MPWHSDYNAKFLANPGQNDAEAYGVTIALATVPLNQAYFRIIGIHHLTGAENVGNHHVYLEVLDENGQRINGAFVGFVNNNLTGSVMIDKGDNEPGANIPMNSGDTFNVKASGLTSDEAKGFHTRHKDEEIGNTWGHHSYYVVFQRTPAGSEPDPIPDPTPGLLGWRDKLSSFDKNLVKFYQQNPNTLEAQLIVKLVDILNGKL